MTQVIYRYIKNKWLSELDSTTEIIWQRQLWITTAIKNIFYDEHRNGICVLQRHVKYFTTRQYSFARCIIIVSIVHADAKKHTDPIVHNVLTLNIIYVCNSRFWVPRFSLDATRTRIYEVNVQNGGDDATAKYANFCYEAVFCVIILICRLFANVAIAEQDAPAFLEWLNFTPAPDRRSSRCNQVLQCFQAFQEEIGSSASIKPLWALWSASNFRLTWNFSAG